MAWMSGLWRRPRCAWGPWGAGLAAILRGGMLWGVTLRLHERSDVHEVWVG